MLVERASHPQFLSNTYLVADGEGGPAFFVDAGGPVEPLIEAAERLGLKPTHVLLTHHHFDHVSDVGELLARWPKLEVLISERERELLESAAVGADGEPAAAGPQAGTGLDRGRPDAALRHARGTPAAHARPHRRDAVVPRRRAPAPADGAPASGRTREEAVPGGLAGAGLVVFTGDTLFKDSVGGVRAPGHTTYTDLRDSIMGTLMELPPDTVIYPGHSEETSVAREWELQRLHPRLAGSRSSGLAAMHRARPAGHAGAAGGRLRRWHQGLGALAGRLGRHRSRLAGSAFRLTGSPPVAASS